MSPPQPLAGVARSGRNDLVCVELLPVWPGSCFDSVVLT